MMFSEVSQANWFFRQSGAMWGPYSTGQLGELLAAGHILPVHVVWREDGLNKTFVRAAGATKGDAGTHGTE